MTLWQVFNAVDWGQEESRPECRPTPKQNLAGNWETKLSSPKGSSCSLTHTSQLQERANTMVTLAPFLCAQRPWGQGLEWTLTSTSNFFFVSLYSNVSCHLFCTWFWNTAMLIYLHIVYACFLTNRAESSSHTRGRVALKAKNNHYLAFIAKTLLAPIYNHFEIYINYVRWRTC